MPSKVQSVRGTAVHEASMVQLVLSLGQVVQVSPTASPILGN